MEARRGSRRIRRLGRIALALAVVGVMAPPAQAVRPDEGYLNDPAGELAIVTENDQFRPYGPADDAGVAPASDEPSSGLDWRDGVVGAAAGLGLVLLALGSLALFERARTRGRPVTA